MNRLNKYLDWVLLRLGLIHMPSAERVPVVAAIPKEDSGIKHKIACANK